jgi:hypothetical protein
MAAPISLREDFDGPRLRALVLSGKAGTVTWRLLALVTIYDGCEDESEAAFGLLGEPRLGLPGDVSGVIVVNDLDGRGGRIGGVESVEKFDDLTRAMSCLDAGVSDADNQIDASQQAASRSRRSDSLLLATTFP